MEGDSNILMVVTDEYGEEREIKVDEMICSVCGKDENDELVVLCDGCPDGSTHIYCMDPPLDELPEEDDDWFCKTCIELERPKMGLQGEEEDDKEREEDKRSRQGSGRQSLKPKSKQRLIPCPTCGRIYTTNAGLRYHKPRCTGENKDTNDVKPMVKVQVKAKVNTKRVVPHRPSHKRVRQVFIDYEEESNESVGQVETTKSGRQVRRISRKEFTSTELVDLGDESRSDESDLDEIDAMSEDNDDSGSEEEFTVNGLWSRQGTFSPPSQAKVQAALALATMCENRNKNKVFFLPGDGKGDIISTPVVTESTDLQRNTQFRSKPDSVSLVAWLESCHPGKDPPIIPLNVHVQQTKESKPLVLCLPPLTAKVLQVAGNEGNDVLLNAGGSVRTTTFCPRELLEERSELDLVLAVGTSQIGYYETSVDENSDVTTATRCRWGVGSETRRLRLLENPGQQAHPGMLQLWKVSSGSLETSLAYVVGLESKGGAWELSWSRFRSPGMLAVAALVCGDGSCSILHLPALDETKATVEVPTYSDSSVVVYTIPASYDISCCSWNPHAGQHLKLVTGNDGGELHMWDFTGVIGSEVNNKAPQVSVAFKSKSFIRMEEQEQKQRLEGGDEDVRPSLYYDRVTSVSFSPSDPYLVLAGSFGGWVRLWSTLRTTTARDPTKEPLFAWLSEGTLHSAGNDLGPMASVCGGRAGSIVQTVAWGPASQVLVGFNDSPAIFSGEYTTSTPTCGGRSAADEAESAPTWKPLKAFCSPTLSHLGTTWAMRPLIHATLGPLFVTCGSAGAVCVMSPQLVEAAGRGESYGYRLATVLSVGEGSGEDGEGDQVCDVKLDMPLGASKDHLVGHHEYHKTVSPEWSCSVTSVDAEQLHETSFVSHGGLSGLVCVHALKNVKEKMFQ